MRRSWLSMLVSSVVFCEILWGCAHGTVERRNPASGALDSELPQKMEVCGLQGRLEERVQDCARFSEPIEGNYFLVTRTVDQHEVYWDKTANLIWGDRLAGTMDHRSAQRECARYSKIVGVISGTTWRLPEIDQFKEAEKRGIGNALPRFDQWLWAVTGDWAFKGHAWIYSNRGIPYGSELLGGSDTDYRVNKHFVRCIAQ